MSTNDKLTSPHAEGAKVLLDKLRAFRAEIPRFTPYVPDVPRRLALRAGLSDEFMESAGVSVDRSNRLELAAGTDAVTLRDSFGFALAYQAVAMELLALGRDMLHTIRVQRAEAGSSALDVYAIARRLAARKDGAELLPHVEDMRKKLRKRSRRTTSNPAPAPLIAATPSE